MTTNVTIFTFNPFQVNTYLLHDGTGECIIFDPGCNNDDEKSQLKTFIERNNLKPVRLINTHCHIDHVFGNKFVSETWNLPLEIHRSEVPVLEAVPQIAQYFGVRMIETSPDPKHFIEEGEIILFGETELKAILTPGHSPGSLCFYCDNDSFIIAGDVLFRESIGRTDLPGGDFDALIRSIKLKLLPLGDEVKVYPGHGPSTTIGHERASNPFF
jgi:hydroxyacylglutathione hydrolase